MLIPFLFFYGLLAIVFAAIGNHFCKKSGFSDGYVLGNYRIINYMVYSWT